MDRKSLKSLSPTLAHPLRRGDTQEVSLLEPTDVTIEILKDIRNEVRQTRTDLSEHIDGLSRRVVESEIRTATAIADLAGAVNQMTGVLVRVGRDPTR